MQLSRFTYLVCVDRNKAMLTNEFKTSGGELLKIRLLDNHLLDTFGSKSTARHEIDQLLESS